MFYLNLILIIGIILITLTYLILSLIPDKNYPKCKNNKHDFCILIPARDESNVIEGLLLSIKNQSYNINLNDVYVIVEDEKDKTVEICKQYNVSVIVRKKLNLRTKGYALDEALKIILKKKKYDAYFIFDADNVLDKDYFKNMISVYDKGYDIATGYRNTKNGDSSVVAAASSLTFSLVNTVFNKSKCNKHKNITLSGTGFYIKGDIINKFKGFPFNSLTEDYEFTMYSILNCYTTYYNEKSVFFDEQPVKYKDTINQRIRWIKGYFNVRKLYNKKLRKSLNIKDKNYFSKLSEIIGIYPIILLLLYLFIYVLLSLLIYKKYIIIPLLIALTYFILFLITLFLVIKEKNKIKLSLKNKILVLFYNPIFMFTYVFCAIKAFTKKEVVWTKIKHGK